MHHPVNQGLGRASRISSRGRSRRTWRESTDRDSRVNSIIGVFSRNRQKWFLYVAWEIKTASAIRSGGYPEIKWRRERAMTANGRRIELRANNWNLERLVERIDVARINRMTLQIILYLAALAWPQTDSRGADTAMVSAFEDQKPRKIKIKLIRESLPIGRQNISRNNFMYHRTCYKTTLNVIKRKAITGCKTRFSAIYRDWNIINWNIIKLTKRLHCVE